MSTFKYGIYRVVDIDGKGCCEVSEAPNVVFIGRKPVMSYVLAIITGFAGSDASEVVLRARGRAITTAVDVAEVTRRRFMKELQVSKISIGTEEMEEEGGRKRAVSTMEIVLVKQGANTPTVE